MPRTTRTLVVAVLAALLSLPAVVASEDSTQTTAPEAPTYHRDVLPILQRNCQDCHRPAGLNLGGMVAPMSLLTYDEVRPWSKSIARAVKSRYMPPWHAAPEQHGVFSNERYLSEAEIETLVRWVQNGAPQGDPADAPPPVEFVADTAGWAIGEPDLVIDAPDYLVGDDVEDQYVNLEVTLTEEQLPEDRWIKAVEFRPTGSFVHHIIARPLGGIAPGYEPKVYEEGQSALLRKGTTITFQMHYHKEAGPGTAVLDDATQVAVKFYEPGEVITHVMEGDPLGTFRFVIPPNDPNYSDRASYTFEKDAYITAFNPHMHLRGKAAKYVAKFPDGSETVLLDVPQYDFNWQHTYYYNEPVFVPKGTEIELTLWWDNSADNPANPNPDRAVRWGRPTTDEMGFGWMAFVDAQPRHIVVGEPLPDDVPEAYRGRAGNERESSDPESSSGDR